MFTGAEEDIESQFSAKKVKGQDHRISEISRKWCTCCSKTWV